MWRTHERYMAGYISSRAFIIYQYDREIVFNYRSTLFAEEIIRLLQETEEPTTFFITVGIGHMIGDDYGNVFNVLENHGFDIVRLYRGH